MSFQIKKQRPLLFVFILCLMLGANISKADENLNWQSAKKEMRKKLDESDQSQEAYCDIIWDTVWSWAKKGNLEARGMLAVEFFMNGRRMPGHYDWTTAYRDTVILSVYATGSTDDMFIATKDSFYLTFPKYDLPYKELFSCLKTHNDDRCIKLAIEKKVIPSFSDYAQEIDDQIAKGKRSICLGGLAFHGKSFNKKNEEK